MAKGKTIEKLEAVVMENTTKKTTKLTVLKERDLVDVKNLKKMVSEGENGQYIALMDITHTEKKLIELAERCGNVVVTRDNYNKEAKEAESILRQSRYALQNIHKNNNNFINNVKREEKKRFDELIELIKPQEDRLYLGIKAISDEVKAEKEKKKKQEEERIKKIKETLSQTELDLEKFIAKAKTREQLKEYDEFLADFEGRFNDFQEFDFDAKRLHVIYKARRSEIVKAVDANEELERERESLKKQKEEQERKEKERKEQEEAMKDKIMKVRSVAMEDLGFKLVKENEEQVYKGFELSYKYDSIRAFNELEYLEHIQAVTKKIKAEIERKSEEKTEKLKKVKEAWAELVELYKKSGGTNLTMWKIRKDEIPSTEDFEKIKTVIKSLQQERKAEMLKLVHSDIKSVKDGAIRFLEDVDNILKNAEFKHKNSKPIIENFKNRLTDLVNEVFGEVYNK